MRQGGAASRGTASGSPTEEPRTWASLLNLNLPNSPATALERVQARALRQAVQHFKAGDSATFHETLSVASFRDRQVSVTLARPQDPDCPIIGVSDGFELLTGYNRSEIVGKNCRFLNSGCVVSAEDRHAMRIAVRTGRSFIGVLQNRRKQGDLFRNLLHMSSLRIGTTVYILGIQADVTNVEVDLAKQETLAEIERVVDDIFAANVNAWATLQVAQYGTAKLGKFSLMPYMESLLQRYCEPERYYQAREAFVSVEHGLLQNHIKDKNTFLEVYDTEGDPKMHLLGLRRVFSEPSLAAMGFASVIPEQSLQSMTLPRTEVSRTEVPGQPALGGAEELPCGGLAGGCPFVPDEDGVPMPEKGVANCQGRKGPLSIGSAKHPDKCTACSFHCYSLIGCSKGADCQFCHEAHPRRGRRRGRKRRGKLDAPEPDANEAQADGALDEPECSASSPVVAAAEEALAAAAAAAAPPPPQAPAPAVRRALPLRTPAMGLLPLLSALELLAPLPALPAPQQAAGKKAGACPGQVVEQATGSGSSKDTPPKMSLSYNENTIVITVGQWRNILPFVRGASQPLVFSVRPALPRGLSLEPSTGVISGVVREAACAEATSHTVVMKGPSAEARVDVSIVILVSTSEANSVRCDVPLPVNSDEE